MSSAELTAYNLGLTLSGEQRALLRMLSPYTLGQWVWRGMDHTDDPQQPKGQP
jgi:hypothetical protein